MKLLVATISLSSVILFSGCATSNAFAVGYEKSACESSAKGGFCGSPSAIYKYKKTVKKIQEDYKASGFPDDLYFSITRAGKILVKADREDRWQPYENSRYEEEINRLLSLKYGNNTSNSSKDEGYSSSSIDLSKEYERKIALLRTTTNVGQMIRDNGKYTRAWVAPHVDTKGDLISAHELYIVLSDPKWIIGEKLPKKNIDASTATPFSRTLTSAPAKPKLNLKNRAKKYDTSKLEQFLGN